MICRWAPGFAALATIHILDAGENGISDMITSLQEKGFITLGAGLTHDQITQPLFGETTEGKLAIINWVFPEADPDWMSVPGPNCWPGIDEARFAYGFWRNNRPNDFRASGSERIDYEHPVPNEVLSYCLIINKELHFDSMCFDILFTNDSFIFNEMFYNYVDK